MDAPSAYLDLTLLRANGLRLGSATGSVRDERPTRHDATQLLDAAGNEDTPGDAVRVEAAIADAWQAAAAELRRHGLL